MTSFLCQQPVLDLSMVQKLASLKSFLVSSRLFSVYLEAKVFGVINNTMCLVRELTMTCFVWVASGLHEE